MPPARWRCSVHHGPDHKHKPNWHCPRWAINSSGLCRWHGGAQPKNYAPVMVTVEGHTLDQPALRRAIEQEMLRIVREGRSYRR